VYTRTVWLAALPVAALICMSAWGQTSPGGGGNTGGSNAPAPSGAATTRTPGTPGAADSTGTLQASAGDNASVLDPSPRKVAALKKQAAKESRKNAAAAADAAKAASSAPPK
jgi:hypothetical protein